MKKQVIGRNELISIPDWGIRKIRAKIDTGAQTSSLHVEDIKFLPKGRARFYVVIDKKHPKKKVKVIARIRRVAGVRTSTGVHHKRLFVKTIVKLGLVERKIEINLVDRGRMTYRMLLGRTAFADAFLVDAARSYILTQKARSV